VAGASSVHDAHDPDPRVPHHGVELRNDLFDHLARLPAGVYRTRKVGDLMSRATNDLDAVRDLLGPGIMYFANTATTLVMAVSLMCRIDVRLTLLALLPLPILSLLSGG
jgi:ATP-binding cassette subfamily B protein